MCERSDNPTRPSKAGKLLDTDTWDALKAAGFSEGELQADQPFGPIIFAYTRADAIRDGVLVDVTDLAAGEGFQIPVAVTSGVHAAMCTGNLVVESPANQRVLLIGLLRIVRRAIRRSILDGTDSDEVHFAVGDTAMWAKCGPGDDAEPVLTIMLKGED